MILQVSIKYNNIPSGFASKKSLETYKWTMKVHRVPGAEYNVEQIQSSTLTHRQVGNRHGIKLFVSFGGTIAVEDWGETGLLTLVKSIVVVWVV